MILSTRSGPPPNTSDQPSVVAKQASDYLNAHSAMNAGLSNILTLFIFFYAEFCAYESNGTDTFSNEKQQNTINSEIKFYGGLGAIVFSFAASIIWLVHWRKHHQDKLAVDPSYDIAAELDKKKNRSNPWARRFLAGSIPGNFIGQALGDGLGYFLPAPISKVLRGVLSAVVGAITGTIALLAISDGEDTRETASMSAEDRDGKDSWTRSLKIGSSLGSAIGAAIGAILGLIFLGPAGALLVGGLGAAIGGVVGCGVYYALNRFSKPKDVIMTPDDIVTGQHITNYLPKVLCNDMHANKLYLLRVADRINKESSERYKAVLYRSLTPSGRTKTAILKVGLSGDCDIQQDPAKPLDLHRLDNKIKEKILKIVSKRAHIPPICTADSKDRTKYRRMGIALGGAVGGLFGAGIGFGLSFAFPLFAVVLTSGFTLGVFLFGLVGAAALAFGGYYLMKHLGPKISAWVNPDDYTYNTYDYGLTTGQSTAKTVTNSLISLVHQFSKFGNDTDDVIVNAGSLLGAGIGAGYDIYQGRKQRGLLLEELSKHARREDDPDKELVDAETERRFAAKFKANQKITAWSQSAGDFARYGAPLLAGVGFFIGNLIFPGIGGVVGAAIGVIVGSGGGFGVGFFWGDKIYQGLVSFGNMLSDGIRSLFKKDVAMPILVPVEEIILEELSHTDLPTDVAALETNANVEAILSPATISESSSKLETARTHSVQSHDESKSSGEKRDLLPYSRPVSKRPRSPSPILGEARNEALRFLTPGKIPNDLEENKNSNSAPIPRKSIPISAPINIANNGYNKHKAKHKTKLEKLPFLSSLKDTSPVTHDNGLVAEELLKRTQISQLAKHMVRGEEEQAKNILIEHPEYALEVLSASIRDRSGCRYQGYSPLQLAYMVGDVAMCQMILSSLSCLKDHQKNSNTNQEKRGVSKKYQNQHYQEVVQGAWQQMRDIQNKLKPNNLSYDFEGLAKVIKKDTQIMISATGEEPFLSEETNIALTRFKDEFAAKNILPEQRLAIIKLLGDASRTYAEYYAQWSKDQSGLYWSNVIGYLQRLLPASYLQAVCDGLLQLVHYDFKLQVTRYPISEITNALGTQVAILSRKDVGSLTDLSDANLGAVYTRSPHMARFIEEDLTLIEKFHANNGEQMKQFANQLESIANLYAARSSLIKTNLPKASRQSSLFTYHQNKGSSRKKPQDDAVCLYSKYKAKPELEREDKENSCQPLSYPKRRMSDRFFPEAKKLGVRAAVGLPLTRGVL